MEIQFQNEQQVKIADLLWQAEDQDSVELILKTFGKDGRVVHQLMIAAAMDQITDTDIAKQALDQIFK